MEQQIEQLNRRIQLLENLIFSLIKSDKYYFSKHLTFADGMTISLSTSTGSKIGTATGQKLGFFNATPVIQASAIASPSGGGTIDSQARTAIDSIRVALTNIGITA